MLNKIKKNWKEILVVVIVLAIAGLAHGYNMFRFPYYENDEGTYLSQAWSLITQGKLAPYTYWYDHAPVGWIFVSIWLLITRSVFIFGSSINSGRVFMLLIHLASTYLVIRIAKKLTGNILPGVIAALIFSLSPLGIYFQRRLLLDNIMIFWVLWSYNLILGPARKLSHFIISSILFGIAVLTKETAVVFIPGFLFTIYANVHSHNKRFSIVKWIVIFVSVVSIYFLYASLKGELFPYGSILGGNSPHVSLIETLKYQVSRGGGSVAKFTDSIFWKNLLIWIKQDVYIISFGIVTNILLIVISIFKKKRLYLGLCILVLFFWLYLVRGGLVIEFYITPLIPLLSLLIGITLFEVCSIFEKLFKLKFKNIVLIVFSIIILVFYVNYGQVSRALGQNTKGFSIYKSPQTEGQIQAVDWIRKHVKSDAVIVIDNYSYLDLHSNQNPSGIVYPKANYYWKIDQDTDIRDKLLHNNPELIDYIAKTPQMTLDLLGNVSPLTSKALSNSTLVKNFNTDSWGVEIWATNYPGKILDRSWESYKQVFIKNMTHSTDPNQSNITTSEGQSYILLRSVWMNDKDEFNKTWNWTKENLINNNGVFSWKWGLDSSSHETVLDSGSATDADTDIALSLLFAYKRWGDKTYLDSAKDLLGSIWNTEVKQFQGKYYILPGNWAKDNDALIINPSYLSPYAYRIFSEADVSHPWGLLVDSSYDVLKGCINSSLFKGDKPVGLPPNWCEIGKNGKFSVAKESGLQSTDYSYDAIRTMWRLALDYKWFSEPRAKEILDQSSAFLVTKWNEDGKIIVGYTHDGKSWEKYESVLGYALSLANFTVTSPELADTIYKTKVLNKFYEDFDLNSHYWEDPKNYYTQNWAWFGTALYANKLPNLWVK
jgi:endo-1,4-beta-D-glucanase Y